MYIKFTCEHCKNVVDVPVEDMRKLVYPNRFESISFRCPVCTAYGIASLPSAYSEHVKAMGVRSLKMPRRQEMSGEPLTVDDLIDFGLALESAECPLDGMCFC